MLLFSDIWKFRAKESFYFFGRNVDILIYEIVCHCNVISFCIVLKKKLFVGKSSYYLMIMYSVL